MKAILFLLGGTLAALAFLYSVKKFFATPERIFFFTLEVETGDLDRVVEELKGDLTRNGLGVVGVFRLSEDYVLVISCDVPWKGELLKKLPSLSSLIPCPVAVYRREGKVYLSAPKEIYFVQKHREELGQDLADVLTRTYQALRITMAEVATR
ncbi:MAG: DUF302 domain-containing protein [Aquificota bacterium]|nr:DUF302 domain-containing protein [Aquificota bacterium]MDQ7082389.1 DUF302 domain-containing protein [Aquificota bacterium]